MIFRFIWHRFYVKNLTKDAKKHNLYRLNEYSQSQGKNNIEYDDLAYSKYPDKRQRKTVMRSERLISEIDEIIRYEKTGDKKFSKYEESANDIEYKAMIKQSYGSDSIVGIKQSKITDFFSFSDKLSNKDGVLVEIKKS